jgi:hypothetical protein
LLPLCSLKYCALSSPCTWRPSGAALAVHRTANPCVAPHQVPGSESSGCIVFTCCKQCRAAAARPVMQACGLVPHHNWRWYAQLCTATTPPPSKPLPTHSHTPSLLETTTNSVWVHMQVWGLQMTPQPVQLQERLPERCLQYAGVSRGPILWGLLASFGSSPWQA